MAPAQRRAQLLCAAEGVFARLGHDRSTLEDVADAAGVSRTLLYKHFSDKDEIYLDCVRAAREELNSSIVGAVASEGSLEARLRAGLRAYFSFVQGHGAKWQLLAAGTAATGHVAATAADLRYETAEMIVGLVRADVPNLDRRAAAAYAHVISGAAEQAARWWREHTDADVDDMVCWLMDSLWSGLREIAERHG